MNRPFRFTILNQLLQVGQSFEMPLLLDQFLLLLVLPRLPLDVIVDRKTEALVVVVEGGDFRAIVLGDSSEKFACGHPAELPVLLGVARLLHLFLPLAVFQHLQLHLRPQLLLLFPRTELVAARRDVG